MAIITDIEGIGPQIAAKLQTAGVRTVADLLECGRTPRERSDLAAATGFEESTLLKWINHADLFRVRGIGSEYSDLLEAAGVDTVRELAQRTPLALYEALKKTNQEKRLVRKLPSAAQVKAWVKHAKSLKRAIEY